MLLNRLLISTPSVHKEFLLMNGNDIKTIWLSLTLSYVSLPGELRMRSANFRGREKLIDLEQRGFLKYFNFLPIYFKEYFYQMTIYANNIFVELLVLNNSYLFFAILI